MIQFKIKKLANGKELLAVGVPMESKNHISMKVDPDLGMINGLHYDLPHKGVLEQLPNKGTFHVIGTCTPSTGEIDFGIEDSIRRNWVNVPPGEFYNTKRKESFLSLITQSATEAGFYIVNPSPIQVLHNEINSFEQNIKNEIADDSCKKLWQQAEEKTIKKFT